MTSGETQTQIFANWLTSHAKRMTKDNRKNSEYHVVIVIRSRTADRQKTVLQKNHGQTMLKMRTTKEKKQEILHRLNGITSGNLLRPNEHNKIKICLF